MLAFGRRLPWLQRSQEQRTWRQWGALDGVFELTDQTLVLVGLGSIGLEIAKRVQSFGVHVIGVRRSNSSELPANIDETVTLANLDSGLDVTEPEPLPEDSPLWGMANVILTSHSSGHSPRMIGRRYELLCENIRRYLAGEPMINVVDQTHGY